MTTFCDNTNPQWELMIFHLSGHRLNDFGSQAYVENALSTSGLVVTHRQEYLKLSERLHKPDWRDAFLAS